jgi:hypothetical protein
MPRTSTWRNARSWYHKDRVWPVCVSTGASSFISAMFLIGKNWCPTPKPMLTFALIKIIRKKCRLHPLAGQYSPALMELINWSINEIEYLVSCHEGIYICIDHNHPDVLKKLAGSPSFGRIFYGPAEDWIE